MNRQFRSALAAAALLAAGLAQALEIQPYSEAALASAQAAGQPVAVHFHADWCPTCRAQAQSLQKLKAEAGLDVRVLVANYDTEKDLKARLHVRSQSVMVVFRGPQERGRLAGETSVDAIRAALKTAL
jgi:thiol-disulfide isomerase/thioredoxin